MQHTEHYQLSQFEKDDRIQMEEFNADNAAIDAALNAHDTALNSKASTAALGALTTRVGNLESSKADQTALTALAANVGAAGHNCRIACGSYVGNGTYGASSPCVITCDFTPQVVMVARSGSTTLNTSNTAVFVNGTQRAESASSEMVTTVWDENSLTYYSTSKSASGQLNASDATYYYVVLGYDAASETIG